MRIMLINPNGSLPMTRTIEAAGRSACAPDTEITGCCPPESPLSIEGHYDGVLSAYHMLQLVGKSETADGYVVACFDDTGVDALRERVSGPVLGIGEAAMHAAAMLSCRFSILTSLQRSVPILEDNAARYGLSVRCRSIHAAELPVLSFEQESDRAYATLKKTAEKILDEDKSDALILGCGGMAHFAPQLARELNVPVVDGVTTAVKFVESLVGLGLKTGKTGGYAFPLPKAADEPGDTDV